MLNALVFDLSLGPCFVRFRWPGSKLTHSFSMFFMLQFCDEQQRLVQCTIQKSTVILNCVWHQDSCRGRIIGIIGIMGSWDVVRWMPMPWWSSAQHDQNVANVALLRRLEAWLGNLLSFAFAFPPSGSPFTHHPSMVRLVRLLLPWTFALLSSSLHLGLL